MKPNFEKKIFASTKSFACHLNPIEAYKKIAGKYSFLLHSSLRDRKTGNYSYIGYDPFLVFKSTGKNYQINGKARKGNPLEALRKIMKGLQLKRPKKFPLFYGGCAGYFSYDVARLLEKIPKKNQGNLHLPEIFLVFPKKIIAFDHAKGRATIIGIGSSEKESLENAAKIQRDLESCKKGKNKDADKGKKGKPKIKALSTRQEYEKAVKKARDYVLAGDAFQVNLSQGFEAEIGRTPFVLYEKLAEKNPAPFSSFLDFGDFQIASSSPERLVKVERGKISTRPIGGTRKRGENREDDLALEKELLSSEKERAEHSMLVDLERNDIGRVSETGSVKARELFTVERYARVMHLVSEIEGKLASGKDCIDVFKAMFPGGTITGCPKVRVMEIIEELEKMRREVYCGSIGFMNFNREMDLNIAIRTIVLLKDGKAFFSTGAGIVADSKPKEEYIETLHKAKAIIEALEEAK